LDDTTRKELLETAFEECDRLNRLVINLLDMTRMEAGALRISRKPCELRDVLGASLEQLKEKIGPRNIRIDIPRDFPEISMDFLFMMKVFFNLLDNAFKYSPVDIPIDIKATAFKDKVRIEVKDQGIGIPQGDLKRIFEKFYRVERPHKISGTGLGLSICKGIIEAHGGEITAQNNPDKGATFTITIPLH
jgi:two-component system sensor histidine kinase KdpD